jgi:DNA-binding response OmpR family regulator
MSVEFISINKNKASFNFMESMENKKKILIIEDDLFIRDIYHMKFSQEGFDVVIAEDGIRGLEELEKSIPDIVLLDVVMPRMNGVEVLKTMRNDARFNKIPIIMLTNISEKENISQDAGSSPDDYLIKSHFAPSEVVDKVNALLNV